MKTITILLACLCLNAAAAETNGQRTAWGQMMHEKYSQFELTNYFTISDNTNYWYFTNSADGSLKDADGNYIIRPWRTMLPARVGAEVVTNWVVTSVESPVRKGVSIVTLEYRCTGYHETGTIVSNTVATIFWKDQQIPVVIESVQIGTETRVTWK